MKFRTWISRGVQLLVTNNERKIFGKLRNRKLTKELHFRGAITLEATVKERLETVHRHIGSRLTNKFSGQKHHHHGILFANRTQTIQRH
jgi:hypothetical protein